MPDRPETAAFGSAQNGDRWAFDALQRALEPVLWRFIDRLIGPSVETPDVVQKTFLALYLNIEKLESFEHVKPFLYRVARNLCYDELRRKRRFEHVPLDEGEADQLMWQAVSAIPVDTADLPDEAAHFVMLYGEVQKAMERLPEHQRQTLILYAEEDLTYAQIAEAMNVDVGTVRSRIHNGRKNLLKHLKPEFLRELGVDNA